MNKLLGKCAVLTIDLHRGHLDPSVATLPLSTEQSERVVKENSEFLRQIRELNIPVIHVVTAYRSQEEILNNRYWKDIQSDDSASRKNILNHNLKDSAGLELMPGVFEDGDYVVDTKKRYNCFLHTDLKFLLDSLQIETLLITGVNTNSCVLATSTYASCLDYRVVIVKNCVDSMDGPELHEAALKVIESAYGSVKDSKQLLEELG
ncbi:cysteine hydrolase family protein [Paenactinomyces guangxiensis]|uniref:Cysteine hydrolase n=1 Tax=Paenactinomyces guangxiensis TaxID=1490290 RepID=A0A7W1WQ02_9BACL|nr:isochorismatase family cysteine hydrolase [Paenactinomyces guangxiensis]MBA4493947.1 cysteine hydrolase [Paenactinomyces guangxiensis]MBH8591414.1 cysteine hydrolase [Paenactinomyces guangxiensis]